jgi:aspartate racemase
MRTIGLLGGMSWESTAVYYRHLNEEVRRRFGGLASADVLVRSLDFESVVALQKAGDWAGAARLLGDAARGLERAGAACVLICTNTMHLVADEVQQAVSIPLMHIVDTTAAALAVRGIRRPLLLATRYTMEEAFYRERLARRHGIEAVIPACQADRDTVHAIIFEELCRGVVREASRRAYREIIDAARADGIDGVILGCTEIGLLMDEEACGLPTVDSTIAHADAALDFALARNEAARTAA